MVQFVTTIYTLYARAGFSPQTILQGGACEVGGVGAKGKGKQGALREAVRPDLGPGCAVEFVIPAVLAVLHPSLLLILILELLLPRLFFLCSSTRLMRNSGVLRLPPPSAGGWLQPRGDSVR
jgi:hypothetical protein